MFFGAIFFSAEMDFYISWLLITANIFFTDEDEECSDHPMDIEAIYIKEDIKEEQMEFFDVSYY